MPGQVIDLSKFQIYQQQINDINLVVKKLLTKQNADVFNKIGSKTELLFESINAIDVKNAPLEEIRELIRLLKELRETCLTLSSYKKYLETLINPSINNLESAVTDPAIEESQQISPNPYEELDKKILEMVPQNNQTGNAA